MKTVQNLVAPLRAIGICAALAALSMSAVQAQPYDPPFTTAVPAALEVPAGNQPYLKAAAVGTQNYLCMPTGWSFVGPQATLFIDAPLGQARLRQQVATHFLSPNPDANGTPRATWQSSFDTSAVWARAIGTSSDAAAPGAIPWLLLQVEGAKDGPTGGAALSKTTYIQRINTTGGVSPTGACVVGDRAFVPYTADYVFYARSERGNR